MRSSNLANIVSRLTIFSAAGLALAGSSGGSTGRDRAAMAAYVPKHSELLDSYKRADTLGREYSSKAFMVRLEPHWLHEGKQFWFREAHSNGTSEFLLVQSSTGAATPAFDHDKLAKALGASLTQTLTGNKLPFISFAFVNDDKAIRFVTGGKTWTASLADYSLTSEDRVPPGPRRRGEAPWTQDTWPADTSPHKSPDGKWTAQIVGREVHVQGPSGAPIVFPAPAGEPNYVSRLHWSPDSKNIVAIQVTPGDRKPVFLIQSTPPEGGRAKLMSRLYDLPGDKVDTFDISLLDPATGFATPAKADIVDYGEMPEPRWEKDGRHFTYEKMDRGYGRWRIMEIDSATGEARALVDDHPATYVDSTSQYRRYCDSGEIIWRSEKDGWGHLYISNKDGQIENQITKGQWVVRGVTSVDEKARQIVFTASGINSGEDPYFIHYYRVNFDGTGLVSLTPAAGNHEAQFSPDGQTLVDTYSTVATPPIHELRRASDGALLTTLAKADISLLQKDGWRAPEVFVAKGRDGKTDIWGVVFRPSHFNPHKKYPILEDIYAGPQDSFVPKSFAAYRGNQSMAELGFIVVQMDGMGTRNRSKAFQDVTWKNLADAGFPDRILWMKALAAKYPSVDITRVGVFGTSAGGQNSTAAMLFHPEFYKVAVSSCGCQDNRMDKIWWNEQYMGLMGPHYAEQSNITNAGKLRGKLLLMVGELDHNVPPESTYRLVDALIKANKDFQFLALPGFDHTSGGPYGERKRRDFFVKNLLDVEPPDWNNGDQSADSNRG